MFNPPIRTTIRLVAVLLMSFSVLNAAIATDSTARGAQFYDVTQQLNQSLSWTHAVGAGTSRLLLVGISTYSTGPAPTARVLSITYGGQTLTRIGSPTSPATIASDARSAVEMFFLNQAGLTAAANTTILATFDPATPVQYAVGGSVAYTGVDQVTPFNLQGSGENFAEATGNSSSPSLVVASASGQIVTDTLASSPVANFMVAGAGQTQLWYENAGDPTPPFGAFDIGAGSTKLGAAPSVAMSWNMTNSASWALRAVSLRPLITTAAGVSISGRVRTSAGQPIRGAVVIISTAEGARRVMTNAFGRYAFQGVQSGQSVSIQAFAKRLVFQPRVVIIADELNGLDLMAEP